MNSIRPIFIIGAPRSGTSITTWALGQHPNIQPMPETAWVASLGVGAYLSHLKGSERGKFSHLSNVAYPLPSFMARIGEAANAIVNDVFVERCRHIHGKAVDDPAWTLSDAAAANPLQIRRSAVESKQRWVDGTPLNTFYVWVLAAMFPEAQFIHNLRRPDEVATSLESFDRVGAEPQALGQGLETWISHTENAWFAERGLGAKRVFRLRFERLELDPEVLFGEICAFLGEDYSAACLLPLFRKLNSSQVADKREHNQELLREDPSFQHAQAVYTAVSMLPGDLMPDATAWQVVHERFLDYCRDRSIV